MKYILFLLLTVVMLSCGSGENKAKPKGEIMPLADLATIPVTETYYAANGDTVVLTKVRKTFFYDSTIKTVKPFKGSTNPPQPPPPTSTTRQNLSFDPGVNISSWPVKGTPTSYGITSTTFAGKSAYRFEVRKTDPIFAGGLRAELSRHSEVNLPTYEVWYGMSYYIPTDWVNDQPNLFDIVHQWHDNTYGTNDGTEFKSPFDFSIDGTQWKWQVRYGTGTEKAGYVGTVEKGKWIDFVFHIKFVKTGTAGLVEIWKDGGKVLTYNGSIGYNHYYAPFFKMGIYKWPWNPQDLACCGNTNSTSHTIYISNFRQGNAKATYTDVSP